MPKLVIDDDGSVLLDVGTVALEFQVRPGDDISASELVDGAVAASAGWTPAVLSIVPSSVPTAGAADDHPVEISGVAIDIGDRRGFLTAAPLTLEEGRRLMFASFDRPAVTERGEGWHITGPRSSFITNMLDHGSLLTVASVTDNDSSRP